jgi:hypothetical protein
LDEGALVKTIRQCVHDYIRVQIADPSSGAVWERDTPTSLAGFRDMVINLAHEERCAPINIDYDWDAARRRTILSMLLVGGARLVFRLNPEKEYPDALLGAEHASFDQGFSAGVHAAASMALRAYHDQSDVRFRDLSDAMLLRLFKWQENEGVVYRSKLPESWVGMGDEVKP